MPEESAYEPAGAAADERYAMGVMTAEPEIHFLDEITAAEYEEIENALVALAHLEASFHYKSVERNFLDVQALYQYVTIVLSLGREFATPDRRQITESLMTSIVNWLTSMRLFLDHTETDLKRRFGKESSEVERFKTATAEAYDGELGYRFASRFRNYVQHCGLPLSSIDVGPVAENGTRAVQSVRLLVDRDHLVKNFGGWGPVRRDLDALQPKFELQPLIASAMKGIREVQRTCVEIELDHALEQCVVLTTVLDRIEKAGEDGQPTIFRYNRTSRGGLDFSPRVVPADAVRTLASVARGDTAREALWSATTESPPLPFDPATIRERFHRDSRGVQAITAWLAEGGGTEDFFRVINDLIKEDGDTEPLITGLTNVGALLVHISAGALGTSAEGFVAGLLDMYGQFDQPAPTNIPPGSGSFSGHAP